MNRNPQVEEDYKFRITYLLNFFKDLTSTSEREEDKELMDKIEKIEKEQDNTYLKNLEKELEIHEVFNKRNTTKKSAKEVKVSDTVKENAKLKNNETILDEEKDR